jgi:hypothetical protein
MGFATMKITVLPDVTPYTLEDNYQLSEEHIAFISLSEAVDLIRKGTVTL